MSGKVLLDTECPVCHARIQLVLGSAGGAPVEAASSLPDRGRLIETLAAKYADILDVKREGGRVVVRVRGFLKDKSKWLEINSLIKGAGGSWVADGKNSRWIMKK